MPDINKVINNPGTGGLRYVHRQLDLQDWNKAQGRSNARQEGIQAGHEHREVLYCLRAHYRQHGSPENGREPGDVFGSEFADRGTHKYLRSPFPNGTVARGMRIAGLNVPPHADDQSFSSH